MQFKSTDCKFFGHRLTPDRIKVDPKKIEAIIQMDPPQNVASLVFIGMVNYLKKFSSVLSELSEPLRRLCKSGVEWAWESEQQNAFEAIKQVITTLPVLAYFDKTKKHTIQCNSSKKGLGAVLLQESKPVMYVSRALTETEQRYSNIEREILAIVFALERLNHYTFGRTITVQSDHQPLQSIWKKSIVSASSRLQRLLLRLAHYDINIEFLWGKENVIADALSRVCPLQPNNSKIKHSNIDVIPIHHITQSAQVSRTRLQELRLATQSDPTLYSLAKTVHEGWPQSRKDCPKQLLDFWSFRQEISKEDGLLYKNQKLIVPPSERLETLEVLHLGHYAVNKMQLNHFSLTLHQSYHGTWWQQTCLRPRTLNIYYWWTTTVGSLYCASWAALHPKSVQEMKAVFAKLGVPNVIVSDGRPQYTSVEFKDFTKQWQIEHQVSLPRNPQSNGMAEHCVQTMKASLIKTMEEGEDVDLALSPAELLNSRKYKTLLLTCIVPTRLQQSYRQIMDQGKQIQAQLYNRNTRVLPRLKQSQKVVVQLDPDKNIWTPAVII